MKIRVVISGRSYEIAGGLPEEIDLPDGSCVDDALRRIVEAMPAERKLPGSCLLAAGDSHLGTLAVHTNASLKDGDEIVVIAPVAGG